MFKDKKFARRLALVLCLSLVVGILPIGILNAPVQINAVSDNLVVNGSFENGKEGWKGSASIEISDADASDGSYAAVIPATEGTAYMQTEKIAVVPGEEYHLSAMAKRLSGEKSGYIGFWYVDENGAYVGDGATAVRYSADEWTECTMDWTVPAGVAYIWIEFGVNSKANTSFVVDNIVVTKTSEAPEAPSTEATEPSAEAPSEDGVVVFTENVEDSTFKQTWTLTKTAMPWSDAGYKYEGNRVLLIQGANDTATSPSFAVTAGKTYTLTYWAKQHTAPAGAADAGSAQIRFLDANGAVIDTAKAPACAVVDWTEKTISAVAPEGAVNAQLFFDSGDSKLIYVVDAMIVTETGEAAPEVTEPSTEATEPSTEATEPSTEATEPSTEPSEPAGDLVFSDKFEEHDEYDYTNSQGNPAKNLIPKGWTSYQPSNIRAACNKKYFDVYEGYNLFFQEAKGDKWVKSPLFDVAAGNTYTANFMDIKMPGTVGTGAYAALVFVDANGNVLATQTAAAGLANTWTANSVVATAPAGAVAAYVEFGLKSATGNPEFAVDNLEVYLTDGTAPEVTEPSTEATEPSTEATEPSTEATEPSTEATEPSTEATEPSEPAFDGIIPNGGFEDGKAGWLGGAAVEITDRDVYEGYYAAVIPATEASVYMKSEKVAVVPGETYYLSVMAKRLSGEKNGYIGFWYVDENGAYVGDGAISVRFSADEWTEYTMEWTVPEGVAYFWVEWGVNSKANSSFAIDNIVVTDAPYVPEGPTEPEVTEPATEAPIFTDTFENSYTPEGAAKTVHIPVGWTASVNSAAIGSAGYDKYDGTLNLCVQDPKNKWIKSPLIEVVEGYEYTAKYVEKKYQPTVAGNGGYVKIVFVDASGNILKEYSQIAGQSAEWTDKVLLSKAPAGATHMYVEFGLLDPTGEPTYSVDNLAVYAQEAEVGGAEPTMPTEPIPTEPEGTNVMFGDKFETLADASNGNAGPLGWISSDDSNGAYSAAISVGTFGMENDGNFLCLQTPGQWSIRSTKFAAKAGYEYEIKFLARKLVDNANYTGALKVVFLDAYGNVTGEVTETVGKTFGAWTAESVKALAPNGTVAAYLEFSLDNADRKTKGDYGIDDLEVIKSDEPVFVPEEPTEPSNPDGGNTGTGDSAVLLPVFGVMAAVVALAVLVIKKRRFF